MSFFRAYLLLFLCCGLLGSAPAMAASAFQTPDYYYIHPNAYDAINLANAYEQGFTGKGVTLGITDSSVNVEHVKFLNKTIFITQPGYVADWVKYNHGTHTTGIMAGAKDGTGMHGVAFDAKIVMSDRTSDSVAAVNELLKYPEVRVINHSWGPAAYLEDFPDWDLMEKRYPEMSQAFVDLALADKVNVLSAANKGQGGPGGLQQVPLKNPSVTGTMVSVIAMDASKAFSAVDSISDFTNMAFGGAQDMSIAAPGLNIFSADSQNPTGYVLKSGTSMAAPMVTGVLGLVQQAFPYMSAKQLTSTLLSTASKFDPAPYMMNMRIDRVNGKDVFSINFIYFKGTPVLADTTAALQDYYDKHTEDLALYYGVKTFAQFVALPHYVRTDVNFSDVFGHGYLNAGEAVQGPGYFKASWLDPRTDIHSIAVNDNAKEWQYTVDTKGYNSLWSNDIGQIKYAAADGTTANGTPLGQVTEYNKYQLPYYGFASAEEARQALGSLNIGLTKRGQGTLFLTGNNTYKGYTVIENGAIALSAGATPQGSIENAWVQSAGTLAGSGTVREKLFNDGVVSPGLSVGSITTKDFTQRAGGTLVMEIAPSGAYDRLAVTGKADLAGNLRLLPLASYWKDTVLNTQDSLLSLQGPVTGALTLENGNFSPTLRVKSTLGSDYTGSISVTRDENAYSQYARNTNTGNVGQALHQIANVATGDTRNLLAYLDFSALDGSVVGSALRALSPTIYNETAQASIDHNRSNSSTMLAIMQSRSGKGGAASVAFGISDGSESTAATGSGTSGGSGSGLSSYSVIVPQGGGMSQQGQDGAFDSTSSYAGVQGVWNFNVPLGQAGISLGYSRRNTKTGGDVSEASADVLSLGGQVYMPEVTTLGPGALWVYGSAALGLENTQITRKMALNDFYRQNKSDFSAFTASADLRVGWEYAGKYAAAGPFAGLSYGGYFRPALSESGVNATALQLPNADLHSLRSTLGLQARLFNAVGEKTRMEGVVSAAWAHEFLDSGTTQANFAGYGASFYTDNVRGRDSLMAQASLNLTHEPSSMSVSLFGGAETFRQQYTGYNVGVSVGWSW